MINLLTYKLSKLLYENHIEANVQHFISTDLCVAAIYRYQRDSETNG